MLITTRICDFCGSPERVADISLQDEKTYEHYDACFECMREFFKGDFYAAVDTLTEKMNRRLKEGSR